MEVRATAIPEVKILLPRIVRDARGFFSETFQAERFASAAGAPHGVPHGVPVTFVQDNHSLSHDTGVVRGLHFQSAPSAQGKLVRVVRGAIFDVVVDIRRGAPTFGRHVAVEISAVNWLQIWVPVGFAHGFCTLEPDTEVVYKTTAYYDPACDKGLSWNDPALGIAWPVREGDAILSQKDRKQPRLAELPAYFDYVAST